METVHKIERQVEEWLKPLPHLPTEFRKWLGDNIWWITLVGVILSIVAIFSAVSALLTFWSVFNQPLIDIYGPYYRVPPVYEGWWTSAQIVSIVFSIITVGVLAQAVKPLRAKHKKGWDLLFLSVVINVVAGVANAVLARGTFVSSLLGVAIGAFISAYLTFEIKQYFVTAKAAKKPGKK